MLQTLERPRADAYNAHPAPASSSEADQLPSTHVEQDDGLLATAGPIMMLCYGIAFITAVLTFMGKGEALIAVVISIGFAVMFFTIPLLMMRLRARHDVRWCQAERHRQSDQVDTYTGFIDRTSAVSHMVIVPVGVAMAFIGFAVIWTMVRP
ncbi:hypothetical protein ACO2I3_18610 [Leptospira interrogans]